MSCDKYVANAAPIGGKIIGNIIVSSNLIACSWNLLYECFERYEE